MGQYLEPILPAPKSTGRPRKWQLRSISNAIFYLVRSGCAWRMLPREYPPWPTVHDYYRRWRHDGTWEHIHTQIREQLRRSAGREATPSGAILDSQTAKTTDKGGPRGTESIGYNSHKKIKGRKRQLLVDTQGLVLKGKAKGGTKETPVIFRFREPLLHAKDISGYSLLLHIVWAFSEPNNFAMPEPVELAQAESLKSTCPRPLRATNTELYRRL